MSNKYIGKEVVFKPEWSFEDMGGEEAIGLTEEQFYDDYVGNTAVITSVDIVNGPNFEDNYYTIFFSKQLGKLNAWSGCDLELVN